MQKEEVIMVHIIVGEKGKGKTKILLDKANSSLADSNGSVVYLDKSNKHMYELNNKIRLINVKDFMVENSSEFVGFLCGIISQDHDLEQMYLDSFHELANLEGQDLEEPLKELEKISEQFKVTMVISLSGSEEDLPEFAKSKVIVSC